MQQADELILNDLRTLGCQLPEEVKGAADFNAQLFVHCILRCLRGWDRTREYPRSLATTRAQKVHQCSNLVTALHELGYKDDLSYHNLLYPNALDTRKVLGWLVNQIPIQEHTLNETSSLLNQRIEDTFVELCDPLNVWTPSFCASERRKGMNYYNVHPLESRYIYSPASAVYYPTVGTKATTAQKHYFNNFLPLISQQPSTRRGLVGSVLEDNVRGWTQDQMAENEWNTLGLDSGLSPEEYQAMKQKKILGEMAQCIRAVTSEIKSTNSESVDEFLKSFGESKGEANSMERALEFSAPERDAVPEEEDETEEQIMQRREKETTEMEKRVEALSAQVIAREQEIQMCSTEMLQLKALLQKEIEQTASLKQSYLDVKTTLDLVDNAEENYTKLVELSKANREKLLQLQVSWEKVREPLIREYRETQLQLTNREEEVKQKLGEVKRMRGQMKELKALATQKDKRLKQLVAAFKQLPNKDQSRTQYTSQIVVLVNGVKKQRVEIAQILEQTVDVQKQTNILSDTLQRTFAVVEDLVFSQASKDTKEQVSSKSYKLLAELHDQFGKMTTAMSKTGSTKNNSMSLEEQIEALQQRTTTLNMERLEADLAQVRAENAKLLKKYKKKAERTKG